LFGPISGALSQVIPGVGVNAIIVLSIIAIAAGLNLIRQSVCKNISRKKV
jgi:hypothetical protein